MKIRKAVFPVAGLGTRLLPASKAIPKELLPIIDRPLIQFAVDEAVAAGCDTLVFVTNRYKHAIADHFDKAYELETKLERSGKLELLDAVQGTLPNGVEAVFVKQPEALGLGHAVLCARRVLGNEPFAVLLPDDLILHNPRGALSQMLDVATRHGGSVVAVENVPRDQTHRYGIVSSEPLDARVARLRGVVEKPKPADAPSNLAIVGRYVLTPRVLELLESTPPGAGGEIQLTDALALLLREQPMFAYRFEGRRFDCGQRRGVVEATVHLALEDPELAPMVRDMVRAEG